MPVPAAVAFGGTVARMAGTIAVERVRKRGPMTDPAGVPASIHEITTEWLTGALCAEVPGAEVIGFEFGEGSDGTASRRAVRVAYNSAGTKAGLPTDVYTKSTPRFVNRALVGVTGAADAEALFYREIRPTLDLGAPAGYHGASDARTSRTMILMEDIVKTRGATFGNASTYVTREDAESMVDEMARYHGGLWEDPRLDATWTSLKDTRRWQQDMNGMAQMDRGAVFAFRFAPDEIPAELHRRKGELRAAAARSLDINVALPKTLVHQDVHPGNWFRLPDGSMNLYDWQGIAKGNWALDFSYAIACGLTVEDRRAWERDLLERYVAALGEHGVRQPPTFDEAFLAYRQQTFHATFFWPYTLMVGKINPLQPEDQVRILIRRSAQATVDLESIDAV